MDANWIISLVEQSHYLKSIVLGFRGEGRWSLAKPLVDVDRHITVCLIIVPRDLDAMDSPSSADLLLINQFLSVPNVVNDVLNSSMGNVDIDSHFFPPFA